MFVKCGLCSVIWKKNEEKLADSHRKAWMLMTPRKIQWQTEVERGRRWQLEQLWMNDGFESTIALTQEDMLKFETVVDDMDL